MAISEKYPMPQVWYSDYLEAARRPGEPGYNQRLSVLSRSCIVWAEKDFTPHTAIETHLAYWLRNEETRPGITAHYFETMLGNNRTYSEAARDARKKISAFAGKAANDHSKLVELQTTLQEIATLRPELTPDLTLSQLGPLLDGTPQLVRQLDQWSVLATRDIYRKPFKNPREQLVAGADLYTIRSPLPDMQQHITRRLSEIPFVGAYENPDSPHDLNTLSLVGLSIAAQSARRKFWNTRVEAARYSLA